jgi:hypothetical protein
MITYSSSVLPLVQLLCESIRNTLKPVVIKMVNCLTYNKFIISVDLHT